ncbi:hypothetical protein GW742_18720 [Citrobacter freundii]|nr:hypothetical protein [Citrobacter freundii]MBC6508507.1 hypothetical protein [Citrobacter freundii]
MSRYRKRPTFVSLSRRKKRRIVIKLKNKIYQERSQCGGIFYDECCMDQSAGQSGNVWVWSDICFVGKDPAVLWNAEIITAQAVLDDAIRTIAFKEALKLTEVSEGQKDVQMMKLTGSDKKDIIISFNEPGEATENYHVLGGLTFFQYVQKREREIALKNPPLVYCRYQFLPGYVYGLGLRMVVDAVTLSKDVIEAAIADFRLHGEREWCSPEPISFSYRDISR